MSFRQASWTVGPHRQLWRADFQLIDLFNFGGLRFTAVEDSLRNPMFSDRSDAAWL